MALITDPDILTASTGPASGTPTGEVYIDTANKKIELILDSEFTGSSLVAADGVTLQCLYSFLKQAWKEDPASQNLIQFPFPMEAITSEQFEFINGWTPYDDTTKDSRDYIRTGGWAERNDSGVVIKEYAGVITLGNIENNHRVYYYFDGEASTTNFNYDGAVNEAVLIYEDANGDGTPNIDFRDTRLEVFIRSAPEGTSPNVVGYTYDKSTSQAIGVSTLANQVYRFPLSESVDINITEADSEITDTAGNLIAPYNTIAVNYQGTSVSRTVSTAKNYGIIIDASAEEKAIIYTTIQYLLRQAADIDDQTAVAVTGNTADELVTFVGDTLKTILATNPEQTDTAGDPIQTGVIIDNYALSDKNSLEFTNDTGTTEKFPFSATVNLQFNDNLVNDPASKYYLFYKDLGGGVAFGTSSALLVKAGNALGAGTDVTGFVHATAATATGNNDGGAATVTTAAGGTTFTLSGVTLAASPAFVGKVLEVTAPANIAGRYFIESHTTSAITIADALFEASNTAQTVDYQIYDKNVDANGNGNFQFSYDYDQDTAGGNRTAGEASPTSENQVVFVCLGLDNAQYVRVENLLERTANKTIPITAPLERNYSDPV